MCARLPVSPGFTRLDSGTIIFLPSVVVFSLADDFCAAVGVLSSASQQLAATTQDSAKSAGKAQLSELIEATATPGIGANAPAFSDSALAED